MERTMARTKQKLSAAAKELPDQELVGTYRLGHIAVDLFAVYLAGGGSFYSCPEDPANRRPPRIKVSTAYPTWGECLDVLLHEVLECTYAFESLRFRGCGDISNDSSNYTFFFNHAQFSQATAIAGGFLAPAIPAMAAAYQRHELRRKSTKRDKNVKKS